MKIFYGIQGTGNGHLERSRIMVRELKNRGFNVDCLVSGRPVNKLFDMDIFGAFQHKKGITFSIDNGKVNLFKTVLQADIRTLSKDIKLLDLSGYDIIISDYEPITAWAGRLHGKQVIGLGHQYAFDFNIPKQGNNFITDRVMKNFAPVTTGIGLHWHHFNQLILPPIIETSVVVSSTNKRKYVIYLPFENQNDVMKLVGTFSDFEFHVYTPDPIISQHDNVIFKTVSREGFKADLYNCNGVICNSGFELASEALQLGKKLLVKPVQAQMEQLSNALAIDTLEYGYVMNTLDKHVLANWLSDDYTIRVNYPNVAKYLVDYLTEHGHLQLSPQFFHNIWSNVTINR